jgi:eukaryotic-like serine/threonine-protein kinase
LIDQLVLHYRVTKKLGEGGMGEVYLAEDIRLERQVALKFLPASYQYDPDRRTKFMTEARATSALRSPYIAAIYDIGEHEGAMFIVMEYVEGELLSARIKRERLPLGEALEAAEQVADALTEAHDLGIVHCDIKSANIILTARRTAKVLDFGIAKIIDGGGQENSDEHTRKLTRQTAYGVVFGTVSHMSPEQALGRKLDQRSDLFSLGVVMFEMLTGRLPFEGSSAVEVIDRILHEEPTDVSRLNPSVPSEMDRIVRKCLEKDREQRYQSARDLLVDLRTLKRLGDAASSTFGLERQTRAIRGQRSRKAIDSIAILPLTNQTGELSTGYLSDGITEALINNLSQLPKLRVMARSTVFRYKGLTSPDAQQIGRDLGVRAVFLGRIAYREDELVIKAELVDSIDGSHLWGEQYTRQISDIYKLEEDISRDITESLKLKLTGAQKRRLIRRYTENTEAYQLYLKGRFQWNKRTEEGIKKAIEHFEHAIALDPSYASAYSGLADAYNLLASYGSTPPTTPFLRAKAVALKALALDNQLAEAHASLAAVKLWREWDWEGAEVGFRRAVELNPSYATGHMWYALYLAARSSIDDALAEVQKARELDPLSRVVNLNVARLLFWARRYDESIEQSLQTIEMHPRFSLAHRRLAMAYCEKKMYAEAESEFRKALSLAENDSETMSALGYSYAAAGLEREARQVLQQMNHLAEQAYVSPYSFGRMYIGLNEFDKAFEYLERVYKERHGILVYVKVEPMFDRVRSDPRFIEMLKGMGLG